MSSRTMLVMGLGNPGKDYESTYHNAGFLGLDHLRAILEKEHDPAAMKSQKNFAYRKYGPMVLITVHPDADIYMNNSGLAAREALDFFKAAPEDLVVLHDDSDLNLGESRLEKGRGAAGHHGVESIIQYLGTNDFWRGRIGIRPEDGPGGRLKAGDFVLSPIKRTDRQALETAYDELARKVMEKL